MPAGGSDNAPARSNVVHPPSGEPMEPAWNNHRGGCTECLDEPDLAPAKTQGVDGEVPAVWRGNTG